MRSDGKRWGLLVAGLLVAFALRVHRLGDQNIWWDEGLSIWAVRHTLWETTIWTAGDVHPPLYFWLLWPWVRLVGEGEFAARFITVLVALLTVAAMAPLGRRLGGKAVGVGALWLLALSRFHIWWSQEMRMYALAAFWATLSFYFLTRALGSRSLRDWAAWIGTTVAALYTIYFSALLLLVQNLFVLIAGLRRNGCRIWGRWAIAQAIALGLFAPWLAFAIPRMRSWSIVEEPVSLGFIFRLNGVLLSTGISTFIERYDEIALLFGFTLLWGVVALLRYRAPAGRIPLPDGLALLLLGTLLPPVMVWLVTRPRALFYAPRVEARYFLSFAPLAYALLAWGLAGLLKPRRTRPLGLIATAAVLAVALWALPGHYADRCLRDDLQSMVQAIRAQAQPGDAVVLVSGDRAPLFLYYYDRPPAPADRPPVYPVPQRVLTLDETTAETELAPIVAVHRRIWLAEVERHLQDPEGVAERWLTGRYARLLTLSFGYNRLSLFGSAGAEVPATGAPRSLPPKASMPGDDLEFRGYDLAVREVRPQDPLRVGLHLRARQPLTLTMAMVGPEGTVWRAELAIPPTPYPIWRMVDIPVLACYPPGRYHFELRLVGHPPVAFGQVRVTRTQPAPNVSRIPHPMQAAIGERIRLLGYGLYRKWGPFWQSLPPGGEIRPGDHLRLDLYWVADGLVGEEYTVFTHLIGSAFNPASGGPVWAQHDQPPLGGLCPTPFWRPASPIRDEYHLSVASDTPAGEYLLEVGMYRPATGERLPVSGDGADVGERRILLGTLNVR